MIPATNQHDLRDSRSGMVGEPCLVRPPLRGTPQFRPIDCDIRDTLSEFQLHLDCFALWIPPVSCSFSCGRLSYLFLFGAGRCRKDPMFVARLRRPKPCGCREMRRNIIHERSRLRQSIELEMKRAEHLLENLGYGEPQKEN